MIHFNNKFSLIFGISFVLIFFNLKASDTYVHSLKNGDWDDGTVWSTGEIPKGKEKITISHNISLNDNLNIADEGSLSIVGFAQLMISGETKSYGNVRIEGKLISQGKITNKGVMHVISSGNILGYSGFLNYKYKGEEDPSQEGGIIPVQGYLVNDNQIDIYGDFENKGRIDGNSGKFVECGDFENTNYGLIEDGLNLCLQCGGSFLNYGEGTFFTDCGFLPIIFNKLEASLLPSGGVQINCEVFSTESNGELTIERSIFSPTETCSVGKCIFEPDFTELKTISIHDLQAGTFRFTDANPHEGLNYYRMKFTQGDKSPLYSDITSIMGGAMGTQLVVYPNPSSSVVNIFYNLPENTSGDLALYDLSGRLIWYKQVSSFSMGTEIQISISDFASGTYILNLNSGKQKISRKIILW